MPGRPAKYSSNSTVRTADLTCAPPVSAADIALDPSVRTVIESQIFTIWDIVQHIERRQRCPVRSKGSRSTDLAREGPTVTAAEAAPVAAPVWSVDPRTGKRRERVAVEATADAVDAAVRAAHAARGPLAARGRRAALLRRAAAETGLPADTVVLVHGFRAGLDLVRHPLVTAAGFTGSIRGGRALCDAAAARPHPIPFHGELGSLNPVVVTEAAAGERADEIGTGLAGSMTLGTGQFCVKPGLVLVPDGPHGDRLLTALTAAAGATGPGVMLDHRMRDAFLAGIHERAQLPDVQAPLRPMAVDGGHTVGAAVLTVDAARLAAPGPHDLLLEECFGPVTVLARCADEDEATALLARVPGTLSATLQLSAAESAGTDPAGRGARLLAAVTPLAGRVVVNGWPTGVAVAPAQHHGGPYPATTSTATAVGATAVERWLRPVAYQDTPPALLPPELRDANPLELPRRVDGRAEEPRGHRAGGPPAGEGTGP
ncbi:aldehyde dehydrogenase family protein [Streptomyces sp. A1-5]|nr:aldehyde dehydrogenase family protein [Streptomyces sp. A1-5]